MKTNDLCKGLMILGIGGAVAIGVQGQVPQVAMDSGTELRQAASHDNGTTTSVKTPTRYTVTTAALLKDLAVDKTEAGEWFNLDAKVPANAKLVVTYAGPGDFSSLSYKVVSGTNSVDVSDLLSAAPTGSNVVTASTFADAAGAGEPPFSTTVYQQYTITYDARPFGGKLNFTVTGLATSTATTTKPNVRSGIYTETDSFSLTDGTGAGVDATGTAFVLTGVTVTASGSAKLDCGCGTAEGAPPETGVEAGSGLQQSSVGAGDTQVAAPPSPN